jgi:uncharacterized membrane protein YhaH (DUF805 family)
MDLFCFQGRVGRMRFWLTTLILYGVLMALEGVCKKKRWPHPPRYYCC